MVRRGVYYLNFPKSVKFSEATLKVLKVEFENVRELLVQNFNELRELTNGKWYEDLIGQIYAKKILDLCYDIYFSKENHCFKLKFKPGDNMNLPNSGLWIPPDVQKIYDPTTSKEELLKEYSQMYYKKIVL